MTYYAIFNEAGFPRGFFTEAVHGDNIPPQAIAISDDQWQRLTDPENLHIWVDGDAVTYTPEPPPPQVLQVVSASQAKIALYNAGLLEQVKTLVANHPYEPVRIWYADANQWERGHVYVQALGAELGLTEGDIDALFQAASLL